MSGDAEHDVSPGEDETEIPSPKDRSKSPGALKSPRGKTRLDKWVAKLKHQEQEQRERMKEGTSLEGGSPSPAADASVPALGSLTSRALSPVVSKLGCELQPDVFL